MQSKGRRLAATAAAALALGGLAATTSVAATAKKPATVTYKAGQVCTKSEVGKTAKATNGKTLKCVKKGKAYRWELAAAKKK